MPRPLGGVIYLITRPFETGEGDAVFSVFIDNWSIPKKDIDIYLKERTTLLRKSISSLCGKYGLSQPVSIAPIQLLKEDTSRKRFVDVVASVVSRAYLKTDNRRYSCEAANILMECGKALFQDATNYSINLMRKTMNQTI